MVGSSALGGFAGRIEANRAQLNDTQLQVVQWLHQNADEVISLSITDLAKRVGVSEATIVRSTKMLGYAGYSQIKMALAQEIAAIPFTIHEAVLPTDSDEAIIRKVFTSNAGSLQDTLNGFRTPDALMATDWIIAARKIEFYGIGASGLVATDAYQRFIKLGLQAHAETDGHAQAIRAALLNHEDVVIAISHSGRSADIVDAVSAAKAQGSRIITITQAGESPLEKLADARLFTAARETAWTEEAMASRIAQLTILDALFVIVARRLGEPAQRSMLMTRRATKRKRLAK